MGLEEMRELQMRDIEEMTRDLDREKQGNCLAENCLAEEMTRDLDREKQENCLAENCLVVAMALGYL